MGRIADRVNARWAVLALAFAAAAIAPEARAQCFNEQAIPGWEPGDLLLPQVGSSRPLPAGDGDDVQLCSQGGGFGPASDGFRYLIQRLNGDVELIARLESVAAIGEAGLLARTDVRDPAAAMIRVSVEVDPRVQLFSELRTTEEGAASAAGTTPVVVTLPLWLRVKRSGSVVSTAYSSDGQSWTVHLTHDAAGEELADEQLKVGMFQTSRDDLTTATATFRDLAFGDVGLPPDPGCINDYTLQAAGGQRIDVPGSGMERVTSVSVGGVPATIVSATSGLLSFDTPALPPGAAALASTRIVLGGDFAPIALETPLVFGGDPFLRGDADGDLDVDAADLDVLQDALGRGGRDLHCDAAADLDGDHLVTWNDHALLASWLTHGTVPPPPPFPLPGLPPDDSLVCGQPANPRLAEVRDGAGLPLAPGARIRAGDELRLAGADLPRIPERAAVRFGDVQTTVLADSTPTELHLRVERVPTSGVKCPVLFEDLAVDDPIANPFDELPGSERRFGVAHAVVGETTRSDLCPEFESLEPPPFGTSRWDAVSARTVLEFDAGAWDPARSYDFNLWLFAPHSDSGSRGSRLVSFSFQAFEASTLEEWLRLVAKRITAELGNPDDDCDCDFEAESGWPLPAVILDPCDPAIPGDITGPGPGPDPPWEPDFWLKDPPGPITGANSFQAEPPQCGAGNFTPDGQTRLWTWCEFEKITRPSNNGSGLPTWEFYIPDYVTMGGPTDVNTLEPPQDRTPAQKSIQFSTNAYQHARNELYWSGCGVAARLANCFGGNADWMPAFSDNMRIIKTFWRTQGGLPASADTNDFYSYDPPGSTPRHYLVGMHVVIGTGNVFDPWYWSTFWVPRGADVLDKNGDPLDYDANCTVGGSGDQPAELQGVWQNFAMCNQDEAGETLCGNPWAHGECTLSCEDCHNLVGSRDYDGGNNGFPISFSWMPSLIPGGVQQCLDEINANPGLYDNLVPEACQ